MPDHLHLAPQHLHPRDPAAQLNDGLAVSAVGGCPGERARVVEDRPAPVIERPTVVLVREVLLLARAQIAREGRKHIPVVLDEQLEQVDRWPYALSTTAHCCPR